MFTQGPVMLGFRIPSCGFQAHMRGGEGGKSYMLIIQIEVIGRSVHMSILVGVGGRREKLIDFLI